MPEGVFGQQELCRGPDRGKVQFSGGSRHKVLFQFFRFSIFSGPLPSLLN